MFIAMFISFGNCNGMNHVPRNECPNVNVNNVVRFYSKYQEWLQYSEDTLNLDDTCYLFVSLIFKFPNSLNPPNTKDMHVIQ